MPKSNGQPTDSTPPSASQLETVRDLLFGDTARSLEDRLNLLTRDFEDRLETLEKRLANADKKEALERKEALKDLKADLDQRVRDLTSEREALDRRKADRLAVAEALETVAAALRTEPAS